MNSGLWETVAENAIFLAEFLGVVFLLFAVAYTVEKLEKKRNKDKERILSTRKIAMIGVFSAVAAVLHMLDFPVPFAPPFYKLDFSELPALVGTFAFGPVSGVLIEFCKIVLKVLFKGSDTAFVGDLANFVIGCSFLLPASMIYHFKKNKKNAVIGCAVGTACMTVFGSAFNAVYLLPKFSKLYGIPLEAIVEMGHKITGAIDSVSTLVLFSVVPMNILKGAAVSIVTMLIYKKISPILKMGYAKRDYRAAVKTE